jgi:hypothetical protein
LAFKKPVAISLAFDHRRYRRLTTAAARFVASVSREQAEGEYRHQAEQHCPYAE